MEGVGGFSCLMVVLCCFRPMASVYWLICILIIYVGFMALVLFVSHLKQVSEEAACNFQK